MAIDLHQIKISRHNLQLKLGKTELPIAGVSLKLTKSINQHTKVAFSLSIDEPSIDQQFQTYLDQLLANTTLELNLVNLPQEKVKPDQNQVKNDKANRDQPECLFTGLITQLDLAVINQQYRLSGEALSYTYKMDIQKSKRSFQYQELPYNQLLKEVTEKYGSKVYHSRLTDSQKLGQLAVQYDETDWEFLIRMASRLHLGLVPCEVNYDQWFIFGMPEGKTTYTLNASCYHDYQVIRKLNEYQHLTSNQYLTDVPEEDFLCYQVSSNQYLNIGDRIHFPAEAPQTKKANNQNQNNKNDKNESYLIVKQVEAELDGRDFNYTYLMTPEAGIKQPRQHHPKIAGASIEGKVLAVQGDRVRIHLKQIDKSQDPNQAAWFIYTTAYTAEKNTGWYLMPEINDYVKLYFPTPNEADAIATASIRKFGNAKRVMVDQDSIKYLRTAHGKEIKFSNDEILISGYGSDDGELSVVAIKLNETDGISIDSKNSNVMLYSKGALTVKADRNLKIAAGNSLNIYCKTNSIEMSGPTHLKGLTLINS